MQPGCSAGKQALAQLCHYIEAEGLHRRAVIAIAFQRLAYPARNLGATGVGEARQLREFSDRHDARHDGNRDAQLHALLDKLEVAVGIVEVLGNRRICTGIDLALEVKEVVAWRFGLRVNSG